jgi:hypothetical protein
MFEQHVLLHHFPGVWVMVKIPSKEELKQIPLRALVAYAARCARRLHFLFDARIVDPEYRANVEQPIQIAERFARGDVDCGDAAWQSAMAAGDAAIAAARANGDGDLEAVANASLKAARTALAALEADLAGKTEHSGYADAIETVVALGSAQAAWAAVAVWATAVAAAWADYEKLLDLNLGAFPELGQPIDPSESGHLGPLWPLDQSRTLVHQAISPSKSLHSSGILDG